jgi:hypothetical protein
MSPATQAALLALVAFFAVVAISGLWSIRQKRLNDPRYQRRKK